MNRAMLALGMRTLLHRWVLVAVLAVGTAGILAGQAEVEEPRAKAEQGDASAQLLLGLMYEVGQGVPQDDAEAVKWYRLAAEQGHTQAQTNLGVMYAKGEGVPQDYVEAVKWFRIAVEQGNAEGVPTRRRGRWHGWAVNQILSRQRGKAARS